MIHLALLLLIGCSPSAPGNETTATVAPTAVTATPAPSSAPVADPPAAEAATPVAAQGDDGLAALAGRWKVTAVHVQPGEVQALVENDPADMGAVLEISRERLSWQPHDGGTFTDVCTGPRLTLDGQVSCTSGDFGPPGARLVAQGDTVQLDWYDGAMLNLTRAR